jgi:hypothetical protein
MSATTLTPISGISITLDTPVGQFEKNMVYSGTISQNGSSFNICCQKTDDGLSFFLDTEESDDVSLEQLLALSGGDTVPVPALSQLDLFESIKLVAFSTQFDPSGRGPTLVGFGLNVDKDWELIKDKLDVTNVALEMYYKYENNSKSFTGTITGALTIAQKPLHLVFHMSASDDYELSINAQSDQGLPDIGDIASLIDESMGDTIHDAMAAVHLDGITLTSVDIGFNIKPAVLNYATVHADANIFGIQSEVSVMVPELSFIGKLKEELTISSLLKKMSVDAGFLPELTITKGEVAANIKSKQLSFALSCKDDWELQLGNLGLTLKEVSTEFSYEMADKAFSGAISGRTKIGMFELSLSADYEGKSVGLDFIGSMVAVNEAGKAGLPELLDAFCPRSIELPDEMSVVEFSELDIAVNKSGFNISSQIEVALDFGVASFDVKSIDIQYQKQVDKSDILFQMDSTFKTSIADHDICIDGILSVSKTSAGTAIEFTAGEDMPPLAIPLPLPGNNNKSIKIDVALQDIALSKEINGWCFAIGSTVSYENMYPRVMKVLHQGMKSVISISKKGATLKFDEMIEPIVIDVKPPVGHKDFGQMSINFTNITLSLARQIGIEAELDIALPSEMNNMFGTDGGKPMVKLFRVYNPDMVDNNAVKAKLIANEYGLGVDLLNSPFESIEVEDGYWLCPLGHDSEYGEVKFELPQFNYDVKKMAFSGYGGMEVTKEIRLPMVIIKALLDGLGLHPIAKFIPDAIAIEEVDVFDPETNKINTHKLVDKYLDDLPSELVEVIHSLEDQADKLPDRLKDYLNIELPKALYFNFNFSETGNVEIAIDVNDLNPLAQKRTDNPPIKVIYPSVGIMGPALSGLEFYGFSFGELMGGAFFSCTFDYVSDTFFFLPIILGMEIPDACRPYLSDSHGYQMTTTVKNFYILIEYETGIPIPIPVFFDDFGIDYYYLEGVKLSAHFGFPKPLLDFSEVTKVISDMYNFFTQRSAMMPEKPPGHFDLKFIIGQSPAIEGEKGNPIELGLPKYLGGQALKVRYAEVSAYKAVAHFMNWCKTFSINEIIQAIDIDYRVGKEKLNFFGLEAEVDWAITTPKEFRETAYPKLGLQQGSPDIDNVMSIIPVEPSKKEEGLVTFLKGEVGIKNTLSLTGTFALALASKGFATGFMMEGKIDGLIDMSWAGSIGINMEHKSFPLLLDARASLKVLGGEIAKGVLTLNNHGLYLDAKVDLFPGVDIVKAKGDVKGNIGKGNFALAGGIDIEVGGVTIIKEDACLNERGFSFTGQFLCVHTTFSLLEENGAMMLKGAAGINLDVNTHVGPIKIAGVEITPKISIDVGVHAALAIVISKHGFAAGVEAGFHYKGLNRSFTATIRVVPKDLEHLAEMLLKHLVAAIEKILEALYKDVGKYLEDVGNKAITFTEEAGKAVGHALKNAYKKSAQEAVHLMKGANMAVHDVGHALQSGYGLAGDDATKLMKEAGYVADEVADALEAVYGLGDEVVAGMLSGAGFAAGEVASALKSVYGLGDVAVTGLLKGAGFAAHDVALALKSVYGLGDISVAGVLKGAGFAAGEIASALKTVYGIGGDAVAGVLKGAGFAVDAVGGALKDTFNYTTKQAGKALEGVGFAANQIKGWGGDAIDWVGGAGKNIINVGKKIIHGW